jgi:hypothetical protein
MAGGGSTIGTIVSEGVTLGTPGYYSPLTITNTGAVDSGTAYSAIYGPSGNVWSVANYGLVEAGGGSAIGINLQSSGTVANSGTVTATGPPATASQWSEAA